MNLTSFEKIYGSDTAGVTVQAEEKVKGMDEEKRVEYIKGLSTDKKKELIAQSKVEYAKRIETQKAEILANFKKPKFTKSSLQKLLDTVDKERTKENLSGHHEKPEIKGVSSSVRNERKKLFEKYTPGYSESVFKIVASGKMVSALKETTDNYSRGTIQILTEGDPEKIETTLKNYDLVKNGSASEKRAFLDKKLSDLMAFTEELQDAKTDEEFMKTVDGRYVDLMTLAEMEQSSIERIIDDFKVEPSKEVFDRFKQMQALMVDMGGMLSRASMITSPQYSELNIDDVNKANKYMIDYIANTKEDKALYKAINEEANWQSETIIEGKIWEKRAEGEIEFDSYVDMCLMAAFTNSALTTRRLCGRIKEIAEVECDIEKDNVKYQDLKGKELTAEEAANRLYEGKHIDICDKEGNVYRRMKASDKTWGQVDSAKEYAPNIEYASENDLKARIDGLIKDVDGTTHFYMKSSKEFKEFRKQLNEMKKSDLSNKDEVKRRMAEVSKAAKAYLLLKEEPNTKITENTIKRIEVAEKISDMFERSLTQDKVFQKSEEREEERVPLYEVNDGFKKTFAENGEKEIDKDTIIENSKESVKENEEPEKENVQ